MDLFAFFFFPFFLFSILFLNMMGGGFFKDKNETADHLHFLPIQSSSFGIGIMTSPYCTITLDSRPVAPVSHGILAPSILPHPPLLGFRHGLPPLVEDDLVAEDDVGRMDRQLGEHQGCDYSP